MRYSYAYDVKNPSTGDHKHHWENRDGDAVQGEYGLIDPDGYMRTVQYTSHPHRGFQATVKRQHISAKQQHITTESIPSTRLYDNVRYALTVTHGPGHSQVESASSTELFKTQRPPEIQERLGHSTIPNSLLNSVKTHEKQIVKKNVPETQFSTTTYCNESPELCAKPVNVPLDKNMHIIQDDWKQLYIIPQQQTQYYNHPNNYGAQFINANLNNYRQVYNSPENIVQNTDTVLSNDNNSENQKRVEYTLSLVHSQPHIQTQLQQVHGYQNDIRDIPVSSALAEINSRNGNANVQDDKKLQYALSLINKQPHIKSQLEQIHGPQSISAHNIVPSYKDYSYGQSMLSSNPQRNIPVPDGTRVRLHNNEQSNKDRTVLSQQTKLPLIFVNIQGKYGLPFYPTTKELTIPPENEAKFGYEGIPVADGPRLEISFPSGATSETIYNAGDPTADREQEELVRQLNETCVYFRFNETIEGTEDGTKDNIFNAGDYTAQREEEELIRSTNVTCLNFTADASTNFASGFTLAQYCSQCLQNDTDTDEYNANVSDNNYQLTKNSQINDNAYVQNEENRYRTETQQLEAARVIYPNYGYLNDAGQNVDLAQLYIY